MMNDPQSEAMAEGPPGLVDEPSIATKKEDTMTTETKSETLNIIQDEKASDAINLKQQERRQRKKAKKAAALQRRHERLAKKAPLTFVGQHKWLGGAVDPNTGSIYGIPSHTYQIICITPPDPSNPPDTSVTSADGADESQCSPKSGHPEISTIVLPQEYQSGQFKWLRGLVHNNCLYGIPAWGVKGVLRVQLATKKVDVLPLPRDPSYYRPKDGSSLTKNEYEKEESSNKNGRKAGGVDGVGVDKGRWMWHGGAIGRSSDDPNSPAAIYCIPSNAEHVLKVSLGVSNGEDAVSEIGPSLPEGQNKWYGGILGKDGCIYGMPYTATGVLRIDPKRDSVEILGNYPEGGYKWHGGLLSHTGVIYAFPAHENTVLCVDTNVKPSGSNTGDESWRIQTIPIQRHSDDCDSPDLQYKWLGGAIGADGCVYGMPSDATTILRIDPVTNSATTFGTVSPRMNKWQGGVLSSVDKCVYAVPAAMDNILRIDTDPEKEPKVDFVGEDVLKAFEGVADKWQGGFVGRDNKIYAIPENIQHVMAITPGKMATVEMLTDEKYLQRKE